MTGQQTATGNDNTVSDSLIDASFFKVPFEALKREARCRKAIVENVQEICARINGSVTGDQSIDADSIESALVSALAAIERLKEQNARITAVEDENLDRTAARLMHASDTSANATSHVECSHWRLPRLIVDYMLRHGLFTSASKLSDEANCRSLCDWHIFGSAKATIQCLKEQDCSSALTWCQANSSRLKQAKSDLMFQLHLQEFGEFIKRDDTLGALQYARSNLARFSDTQFTDLKRAMALLVFRKRTKCARYLPLLADTRWDDLATLFLQELLRIHGLLELPLLETQLQAGLTALKCPLSYDKECTPEDPLHMPLLQELAVHLPWAKHVKSKLVCSISKQPIDDVNPPLVMPNGFVYAQSALTAMAARSHGHVTCPQTKQTFPLQECVRAYIM